MRSLRYVVVSATILVWIGGAGCGRNKPSTSERQAAPKATATAVQRAAQSLATAAPSAAPEMASAAPTAMASVKLAVAARPEVVARSEQLTVSNPDTCLRVTPTTIRCWGSGPKPRVVTYTDAVYVRRAFIERTDGHWGYIQSLAAPHTELKDTVADMAVGGRDDVTVLRAPLLEGATVVRGEHSVCALLHGKVLCYGLNTFGELGYDTDEGCFYMRQTMACSTTPKEPRGLGSVEELVVGDSFSCGRKTGGSVLCWGTIIADDSAPGCDLSMENAGPCKVRGPQAVAGFAGAVSIAGSDATVCAILGTGHVACMGPAFDAARAPRTNRTPVEVPGFDKPKAIAINDDMVCAISAENTVRCSTKVLRSKGNERELLDVAIPGGAVELAVGNWHACALSSGRKLWCWGSRRHMGLDGEQVLRAPVQIAVGKTSIREIVEAVP